MTIEWPAFDDARLNNGLIFFGTSCSLPHVETGTNARERGRQEAGGRVVSVSMTVRPPGCACPAESNPIRLCPFRLASTRHADECSSH